MAWPVEAHVLKVQVCNDVGYTIQPDIIISSFLPYRNPPSP